MEDRLLKTKEVADYIRCSTQKLEIDRHKCIGIPFVRIGRSCRYRLSDIEAYLNERKNERWDRYGKTVSEINNYSKGA
jgi:predicted DNA-binding transcriptional regulator AlpA